jgi:hypothetical protein
MKPMTVPPIRFSVLAPAAVLVSALLVSACGPGPTRGEIVASSEGLRFTVTADTLPPRAMDDVTFRVTVRDARTGLPVEGGEGGVWGRNRSQHETSNGLTPLPELGVYTTKMRFITAGTWQFGVQFRRDSLSPFANFSWQQEVRSPAPYGG